MKSLFLVIFLGLLSLTEAHIFMVGGEDGWTLKPSENYTHWAERNRFLVQDQLVFKYEEGMDSVFVVEKDDYAACNKDDPIKSLKNQKGESKFEFDRSGPFYFISGHEQNCEKGQKFIVIVLSTHYRPPHTVPSPKSQPPAVKPPSPSPSNNNHSSKSPSPSPSSTHQHQSESPSSSPSSTQHRSKSPSLSPSLQSPSKSPLSPPTGSTERHWISPTSPPPSTQIHSKGPRISPSPSTQIHSKGPVSPSPNNITPSVNPNSPSPVKSHDDIGAPHPSLQRHGRSSLGSPAPAPSSDAPGFCVGLKETVLVLVMLVASAFII